MNTANEAVVSAYLDLSWNKGKFHLSKDFLSPSFYYKTTFSDEILHVDQYIEYIKRFRHAMPGLVINIDEVMSREDRVMTSISFSGIVEEPIFGIPVSENIITFPAISLWGVANGVISSLSTLIDISGIERQLNTDLHTEQPLDERDNVRCG